MTDPPNPAAIHPEELLAGYVDGSATPEERRVVDDHLATCATCQEEVHLATEARAALASLPELGAPGLAEAGVLALRRAAFQPVPTDQPDGGRGEKAAPGLPSEAPAEAPSGPRPRRVRVAWAQLAAAAAIIVLLGGLVAIPLLMSGNKAAKTASGPMAAPGANASSLPRLIDRGADYSHAQLDILARQLAGVAERTRMDIGHTSEQAPAAAVASPLPTGPAVQDSAAVTTALQCVINGGGTPQDAQLLYLEQAEVQGTPAYIGGFFIPTTKLNVMVVAVSRDGCQPLYSTRLPA